MDSRNSSSSVLRILLVDDFEPFRKIVRSLTLGRAELAIIFEASDGLTAVQKAEELRPDLILMDIGLPSLNGIEAARKILHSNSEVKVLFLTAESSPDCVGEAFNLGAQGYIVKRDARTDLLSGIDAVVRNERFASRSLRRPKAPSDVA